MATVGQNQPIVAAERTQVFTAERVGPARSPATAAGKTESFVRRAAVIVLALLAVGQAAYIGARLLLTPAWASPPAVLIVDSMPSGADVLIDGQRAGTTPFRAEVTPGAHMLELRRNGRTRSLPLTLAAGIQASQYLELSATSSRTGQGQGDASQGDANRAGPSSASGASDASGGSGADRTETGAPATGAAGTGAADGRVETGGGTSPNGATGGAAAAGGASGGADGTSGRAPVGSTPGPSTPGPSTPAGPTAPPPTASRGWVNVDSPITLRVLRDGEMLGSSDEGRLQLPAGRQELLLVNDSVGYRATVPVQVTPGRETTLPIELPQSTINISATPSALVWVDGREVGSAPIRQLALPVGTHEIRFRHPELGERRMTVLVRVGVATQAAVDFTAK